MPFQRGNSQAGVKIGGAQKGNRVGRQKGVPNRITRDFRQAVEKLLANNYDKLGKWLEDVAEGTIRVLEDGTVIGDGPNPGRALDLVAKLAEYAAPKLTRQEINTTNPHAGAHIQIEFVNAPAFSARLIEQAPPATVIEAEPLTLKTPGEAIESAQEPREDITQGLTSAEAFAPLVRPGALERYASRRTEHEPT